MESPQRLLGQDLPAARPCAPVGRSKTCSFGLQFWIVSLIRELRLPLLLLQAAASGRQLGGQRWPGRQRARQPPLQLRQCCRFSPRPPGGAPVPAAWRKLSREAAPRGPLTCLQRRGLQQGRTPLAGGGDAATPSAGGDGGGGAAVAQAGPGPAPGATHGGVPRRQQLRRQARHVADSQMTPEPHDDGGADCHPMVIVLESSFSFVMCFLPCN